MHRLMLNNNSACDASIHDSIPIKNNIRRDVKLYIDCVNTMLRVTDAKVAERLTQSPAERFYSGSNPDLGLYIHFISVSMAAIAAG